MLFFFFFSKTSEQRVVLSGKRGSSWRSKHVLLTRKKVFTAQKRLQQLQHSSRTCFDLDQTERFFFCSCNPRVKFEVEFAARSRLVSLISLLRPFLRGFDSTRVQTLRRGRWPWQVWKSSVEDRLSSARRLVANGHGGGKKHLSSMCGGIDCSQRTAHRVTVRNINRISDVI